MGGKDKVGNDSVGRGAVGHASEKGGMRRLGSVGKIGAGGDLG